MVLLPTVPAVYIETIYLYIFFNSVLLRVIIILIMIFLFCEISYDRTIGAMFI